MKNSLRFTAYCLSLMLLASSCHSTKPVIKNDPTVNVSGPSAVFSPEQYVTQIQNNQSREQNLTAKVRVQIDLDGQSLATNGSLRMRKDDVIQLSLVDPILGIAEVGRLEFTADKVLIIDRYHKQYIDVPYSEVSFLSRANIDFNTLQSLFWNELFQPGKTSIDVSAYNYAGNSSNEDIALADILNIGFRDRLLQYQFRTKRPSATLLQTQITSRDAGEAQFAFDYDDFENYEGRPFPTEMKMTFLMGRKTASMSLDLSNMKNSSDWQTRTPAPAKYTKADPEMIFKTLLK